ncbi:MAG: penicillin-binding protein 2 [Candidatus Moranbacteria bacterium]|jgi:cell division protein FtsI/penicillin-binding protein 2|nr:penicillin-binding protein 2 [Candidatus Moranbacteria bacterium]MBP9801230.1 penicillin-binding protein 2 [Candidatus Moranbacteria bacterium]
MRVSPKKILKKKNDTEVIRVAFVFICFLFVVCGLLWQLYRIQVHDHALWSDRAKKQRLSSFDLKAERGEIFLHDNEGIYPLAVNREYMAVYVVPREVHDAKEVARELSVILNKDEEEILRRLSDRTDPFEMIKHRLNDDEVANIRKLSLKGVSLLPEKYRYYPAENLASHIVGFAGLGEQGGAGGYGIEASFDSELKGKFSRVHEERDAGGRWISLSNSRVDVPDHGDVLTLTLDRVIQHETEKIVQEYREKHEADAMTAIVMEPTTGRILALANAPDFNPNKYSETEDLSLFLNPAVSSTYEPGSVMKPITMAIGIDEKKVSSTTEYVDTGSVTESGYTVKNSEEKVYGRSTMTKVLENSINTGMIFVERAVGHKVFTERLKRFGFGEKTGVKLPAELGGNLHNLSDFRIGIQFYTAAYGQGITVTPLQIVTAYAALANGGMLMRPQIVENVRHADGSAESISPEEVRRVISKETSETIGHMLRSVVVSGHGKRADVPGYEVVGKTGTAQVARTDGRGYEEGKNIGSFVGYAPRENPRFVILIKVDNPKDVQWAESSAAPAFGQLMRFLLEYARIEPTESLLTPKLQKAGT